MSSKGLSRRDFLHLGALTAASVLAASCQPAAPAEPAEEEAPVEEEEAVPTEAPPAEKVVIEWWMGMGDAERRKVIEEKFFGTFNAHYDNIDIDFQVLESDDVLRTALAAGAGPDIWRVTAPAWALELVTAGHVLALDEYADELGWRDKMIDWAFEAGMNQGKLYSVPATYETMVVFYNKTLFESKGWDIPTNMAELEAIAEAAVADEIWPFIYTGAWAPMNEHQIGLFLDHYAGSDNYYQALIGQKPWTDPIFVEAMEILVEWHQKGWWNGDVETLMATDWDAMGPIMAKGDAAMMLTGSWEFQRLPGAFEEAGQEWDWFPMPSLREGVKPVYALAIGGSFMANAKTEHPREAALALDWLFNDKKRALEIAETWSFGEWMVPIKISLDDFPPDTDERVIRLFTEFAAATERGDYGYTIWTFLPPKTEVVTYEGFEEVLFDKISVEQWMEEWDKQFQEEFEAGETMPVLERN